MKTKLWPSHEQATDCCASDQVATSNNRSHCMRLQIVGPAGLWPAATSAVLAFLFALLAPLAVRGELTVVETDADDGLLMEYKMTVTPAAEPVPALKHRLMLREIDLKQGNAAPYYYRALLGVPTARKAARDEFGDDYDKWYRMDVPLEELPLDKLRKAVGFWDGSVMKNLRTAAQRRECDWEWNLEEIRGPEFIAFLLEEIQESRSLARSLMLQTRLALRERRTDDAIDLLRLNYRLGRDVAREPVLVCDLVGIAIAGMGSSQVIELIAQPDSPNLYWALSELPRPLIDIRQSLRTEMSLGLRTFPFILDAETAEHSPEEWSWLLAKAFLDSQGMMTGSPPLRIPDDQMLLARAGIAGMSLFAYPAAKQRLIDSGMDAERVENMPVGKVVAIDSLREYRSIADELEKWHYIPYRVMRKRKPPEPFRHHGPAGALTRGYGYALAATLLPAVRAARSAEQRLVWQIDGIRAVEAIRMHAAQAGRLPKSLDEIGVVPVPDNPATGEPFHYRLDGDTAVLDLPFSDGFPGIALRFEIKLAE